MPKMYCMKCKQFAPIDIETKPIPKQTNCPNCGEVRETKNFPYWKEEFKELFHGYELWYKIVGKKNTTDTADSYRVFMILCNMSESRLETVERMKKATREEPITIQDEIFWSEP